MSRAGERAVEAGPAHRLNQVAAANRSAGWHQVASGNFSRPRLSRIQVDAVDDWQTVPQSHAQENPLFQNAPQLMTGGSLGIGIRPQSAEVGNSGEIPFLLVEQF